MAWVLTQFKPGGLIMSLVAESMAHSAAPLAILRRLLKRRTRNVIVRVDARAVRPYRRVRAQHGLSVHLCGFENY